MTEYQCTDVTYIKIWEYLARIGVPFTYDQYSFVIAIDEEKVEYSEDPSIIRHIERLYNGTTNEYFYP